MKQWQHPYVEWNVITLMFSFNVTNILCSYSTHIVLNTSIELIINIDRQCSSKCHRNYTTRYRLRKIYLVNKYNYSHCFSDIQTVVFLNVLILILSNTKSNIKVTYL